jgi:hypothetical protein
VTEPVTEPVTELVLEPPEDFVVEAVAWLEFELVPELLLEDAVVAEEPPHAAIATDASVRLKSVKLRVFIRYLSPCRPGASSRSTATAVSDRSS